MVMMTELVKVKQADNGNVIVSGRDLHEFLEVQTKYTDWFKRMIEYGFKENVDFSVFLKNEHDKTAFGGVRKITDHALTLDMAKEISMIQRTEKGKQARRYFIQVEKAYRKERELPQTPEERLALTMEVTLRLDKRVKKVEADIDFLKNTSEIDSVQRYQLWKARNRKAVEVLGGKDSNAYKDKNLSRKVFRALEHDFKETFTISRYEDLKKEDFEAAIEFIENWYPPYTLKQEIEAKNSQENLF